MGYRVERAAGPTVRLRPDRVWVGAAEALAQPTARRTARLAEAGRHLAAGGGEARGGARRRRDRGRRPRGARTAAREGHRRARGGAAVPPADRRAAADELAYYTEEPVRADRRADARAAAPAAGRGPASRRSSGSRSAIGDGLRRVPHGGVPVPGRPGGGRLEAGGRARRRCGGGVARAAGRGALSHARRLVARRCLYGADKNSFAVSLARLSLWLVTRAQDEPFTFVDHALRHGDSLVGLDLAQLRGFHWKPAAPASPFCEAIDAAVARALELRRAARRGGGRGDRPGAAARRPRRGGVLRAREGP